MAYELGRPLATGEQVHHIDGNKLNNTPQNLVTFTPQQHTQHHRSVWKELLAAREELSIWRAIGEHLDMARAMAKAGASGAAAMSAAP